MATLLLFAQAREAAGTGRLQLDGTTVQSLLDQASAMHPALIRVIPHCKIWINGEPAGPPDPVVASDEVALLPPVSGG